MNTDISIDKLLDPKFYVESFCKIKAKTPGLHPFILNPAQIDLFNTLNKHNRVILLKARQLGMSTAVAAYLYHMAITTSGINVALIGYNSDLTAELLDKIKTFYKTTPESIRPQIAYNSKYEVSFPAMDSKILVLPSSENVGRGYTLYAALCTELAFWEKAEEKMIALESSIPAEGKLIIESCVTGDTIVFTEKGPRYIRDIHNWNDNPLGFSQGKEIYLDGHYGSQPTSTYYNSGIQKGYTLITQKGYELGMSSVHKMFVLREGRLEFIEAKNIKEGDFLAIKMGQNLWGSDDSICWFPTKYKGFNKQNIKLFSPKIVTVDLAYLIGCILGDGYIDFKHGRVVITTIDVETKDFLKNNTLGLKFAEAKDGIHFNCKNDSFVEFLSDYMKIEPNKAPKKSIPSVCFNWSKDKISAILQGLFDTDGCCDKKRGRIIYFSTSKIMTNQVRILLLNLGILSTTRYVITPPTQKVKVSSGCYRLEIFQGHSRLFEKEVGFRINRKKIMIKHSTEKSFSVPYVGKIIRSSMRELGLKYKDIGSNKSLFSKTGSIRYNTLKKVLNNCKNKESSVYRDLYELLASGYFYDPVKIINPIQENVYDFTVDNGHTVTYNGIVGHQTPNGIGNQYHRTWSGDNGYIKRKYGWWWGYSEEEIEIMKKRINNPMKFAQEYSCEFLSSGRPVFPIKLVKRLRTLILKVGQTVKDDDGNEHTVIEDDNGLIMYFQPIKGRQYCLGADVAEGVTGGDFSVLTVYDRKTGDEVAFWRGHMSPEKFGEFIDKVGRFYNDALAVVEINNHGLTTLTALKNKIYPRIYFRPVTKMDTISTQYSDRMGWKTTRVSRPFLIDDYRAALEDGSLKPHTEKTIDEMITFVFNNNNDMVAQNSFHDDCLFAGAIGFQGFKILYGGVLSQIDYESHMPSNFSY